jgi:hypothetical protein
MEINWPNGFKDFYARIKLNKNAIAGGLVVAVDPSSGGSSLPGYAIFRAGILERSGAVPITKGLPIEQRLRILYDFLNNLDCTPDVLVIEHIGMSHTHQFLHWSIGSCISAIRAPVFIECPIMVWKLVAKQDSEYAKGDEADAICMGQVVIERAKQVLEGKV